MRSSIAARDVEHPQEASQVLYHGPNKHGHHTFSVFGEERSGQEELDNLRQKDLCVGQTTVECFADASRNGYNQHHLLGDDQHYQVAIVPGTPFVTGRRRPLVSEIIDKVTADYEYEPVLAGIIPAIGQDDAFGLMARLGFRKIVGVHMPLLQEYDDTPLVFALCFDHGLHFSHGVSVHNFDPRIAMPDDFALLFQVPLGVAAWIPPGESILAGRVSLDVPVRRLMAVA